MNRLQTNVLVVLALGSAFASAAEPIRRADAHQHSIAQGQLAIDGNRLDLMLVIPGANLVGFEHPPRTAEQQAVLDRALQRLRNEPWLMLPERAGCDLQIEIGQPGFDSNEVAAEADGLATEDRPEQDHNHDHDYDHSHSHSHDAAHAEFQVMASATCAHPESLDWLEIRLFDGWPDNRSIRIDALSERRQWRAELGPERTRMELR